MNNKTLKRAVALLATILMLCSFASAATINSLSCSEAKDKIQMNVDFADDATKGIYIAYAAKKVDAGTSGAEVVGEESFVLGPIVAVFQAETEAFLELGDHGEKINPELITEEYDSIVLKAGDNGAESLVADSFAAEIPVPAVKYTVTYGDSVTEFEEGTPIADVLPKEVPTKEADAQYTYAFAGWLVDGVAPVEGAKLAGNITITAEFTATVNKYTIKFVDEDGTELQSTEVAYGETPVYTGETPVKAEDENYTYEFKGWTPEIVAVTGAATYTAEFTAIEKVKYYTITFVNYDGTELYTTTVKEGDAPEYVGETPVREADGLNTYAFIGWTPAIVEATEDATYTADYEATPVVKDTITVVNGDDTVTLDVANDGTVTVPDTLVFNKESEAEFVFTLYSFVTSDDEEAVEYVIEDGKATVPVNATVYAKYQTAYKVGDVDKDGEITLSDYGAVKRVATGKSDRVGVSLEVVTGSGVLVGDVDFDGEITLSDYGAVKRVATDKSDRVGVSEIRTYINK